MAEIKSKREWNPPAFFFLREARNLDFDVKLPVLNVGNHFLLRINKHAQGPGSFSTPPVHLAPALNTTRTGPALL